MVVAATVVSGATVQATHVSGSESAQNIALRTSQSQVHVCDEKQLLSCVTTKNRLCFVLFKDFYSVLNFYCVLNSKHYHKVY